MVERGGAGSGHHGHKGRQGEVGGSLPSGVATAEPDTRWENFRKWDGTIVKIDAERERSIKQWHRVERDTILTAMEKFREFAGMDGEVPIDETQEVSALDIWTYEPYYSRFFILPDGSLYLVKDHDWVGEHVVSELLDDLYHSMRLTEYSSQIDVNVLGKEILVAMGFVRGNFYIDDFGPHHETNAENVARVGFEFETPVTREVRRTIKDMLNAYFNAKVTWDAGQQASRLKLYGSDEADLLALIERSLEEKGGEGSGHHGHRGRPGEVGGSLPSGAGGFNPDDIERGPKMPGFCFDSCARWLVFEQGRDYPQAKLVHGTVMGRGPLADKRFTHAWVEIDDWIYDVSQDLLVEKDHYFQLSEGEGYVTYTSDEVMKKIIETEHWGPWDDDLLNFREEEAKGWFPEGWVPK